MRYASAFVNVIWPARLLEASTANYKFCFCFLLFFYNYVISYLKIYQTDLFRMLRFGRTMAVDRQSEVSFSIPQKTLPWQPMFASGAAGRANVELCREFLVEN